MDDAFLKEHASLCRTLADRADPFTKKRLLDLAAKYNLKLNRPTRDPSPIKTPVPPVNLLEDPARF